MEQGVARGIVVRGLVAIIACWSKPWKLTPTPFAFRHLAEKVTLPTVGPRLQRIFKHGICSIFKTTLCSETLSDSQSGGLSLISVPARSLHTYVRTHGFE